ncbi:hypothetical protein [Streptomyces pseudovenezuelae]
MPLEVFRTLLDRHARPAELLLRAGPGELPRTGGGTPSGSAVSDAPPALLDTAVSQDAALLRNTVRTPVSIPPRAEPENRRGSCK